MLSAQSGAVHPVKEELAFMLRSERILEKLRDQARQILLRPPGSLPGRPVLHSRALYFIMNGGRCQGSPAGVFRRDAAYPAFLR